jgi:hypothetical protein
LPARWLPLLPLLVAAGCAGPLSVDQPIDLVFEASWSAEQVETLRASAECWNLQFGTTLQVRAVGQGQQQVPFSFSDFVCIYAVARTEPTAPITVHVCPTEHFENGQQAARLLFRVLLHELGHVLNIRAEGGDSASVMGGARAVPYRFSAEDRKLFADSNPGLLLGPGCNVGIDGWGAKCSCP